MSTTLGSPEATPAANVTTVTAVTAAHERAAQQTTLLCLQELEREYVLVKTQRDQALADWQSSRDELRTIQAELASKKGLEQLANERQNQLNITQQQMDALREEKKLAEERLARLSLEGDRLREEIRRSTEQVNQLQQTVATLEATSRLSESQAIPLLQQNERLQVSLDSCEAQIHFLQDELQSKSRDYQRLQADSHDKQLQLQLQLDHLINDKDAAEASLEALKQIELQLQDKVTLLSRELQRLKQELLDNQETYDLQLQQSERLLEKQRDHLQRWEQRCHDLEREKENLKLAAEQAMQASLQDREKDRNELESKYQTMLQEQEAKQQEQLRTLSLGLSLPPAALPASVVAFDPKQSRGSNATALFEDDGEPIGTVELLHRYGQTKAALMQERTEHERVKRMYQSMYLEIQQKTPLLLRQRKEYDLAVEQIQDYQQRLEAALQDLRDARMDAREASQDTVVMKRKLMAKEAESDRLAKQVQVLLISRVNGDAFANDAAIGTHDIPLSVEQMQQQNQLLLLEQDELSEKVAQLENKLQSDVHRTKLNAAEAELQELREDRKKQTALVEKVVQQRDLYRALVAKQDSRHVVEGDGRDDELSVVDMATQHLKTAKKLEEKNLALEDDLASTRAQLSTITRHRDELSEQASRYEANMNSLTEKVNMMERELLSARSQVARAESDAQYHKEKCERLEESISRARDESNKLNSVKLELQRINSALQQSVSAANSEKSRLQSELQQAERKLRLADSQIIAAKAAENRLAEEVKQHREEASRQGTVIDSIRRIEASLSAKSETERDELKLEVERLRLQLADERKNYSAELTNYNDRISSLEFRIKETEALKDKAQLEADIFKKNLLEAQTEMEVVSAKFIVVEGQLKAARQRLGEHDEDTDTTRFAIQTKVESLQSDLENSRKQIDLLKEQAQNYQKLAQESDSALTELQAATNVFKSDQAKEIETLEMRIDSMKKELILNQKMIKELTDDLSSQRGDREKIENLLNVKILSLQSQIEELEKDNYSAKAAAAAMQLDFESLKTELDSTHNNYERELALHAQARTALRLAREEADNERNQRVVLEEKLEATKKEVVESDEVWLKEKMTLQEALAVAEERLKVAQEQNTALHVQLETLGDLVEKNQAARLSAATDSVVDGSTDLQKVISELREVVKFLRSENEMVQIQLDNTKRTVDRERASVLVLKRSLDEARAELQVTQSQNGGNFVEGRDERFDELKAKLEVIEDQSKLLRDSNKVLREESENFQKLLAIANTELAAAKTSLQPAEKQKRELELKLSSLESEKASLMKDLDDWKNRVKSLVSKFNQIDPEDYKRLEQELDQMKKEKESLNAWKRATEEENTRIRTIAKNLNYKNRELMATIDLQSKEIESFNAEKSKVPAKDAALTKELDELKAKVARVAALEHEAESRKKELEGNAIANERLRARLRQYQAELKDISGKEQKALDDSKRLVLKIESLEMEIEVLKKAAASESLAVVPLQTSVTNTQASKIEAPKPSLDVEKPNDTSLMKRTDTTVPSVPDGGFKFGPSGSSQSKSLTIQQQSAGEELQAATSGPLQTKLRAETQSVAPALSSKFASQEQSQSSLENITTNVKASPSPVVEKEEIVAPAASTEEADKSKRIEKQPKTKSADLAVRRMSGEKAEMSYKQRLMEKKRKLELVMERRRQQAAENKNEIKDIGTASGGNEKVVPEDESILTKKPKVTKGSAHSSETKVDVDIDLPITETLPVQDDQTTNQPEERKNEISKPPVVSETIKGPVKEVAAIEIIVRPDGDIDTTQFEVVADASEIPAAKNDVMTLSNEKALTDDVNEINDNGIAVDAVDTETMEAEDLEEHVDEIEIEVGVSAGEAELADGSETMAIETKEPDKMSFSFGSVPSTFGIPSSTLVVPGGAFLDMKPPGSSGSTPIFTFGNSSSITLPMPSQPTPIGQSPFGTFGVGSGSTPSFGVFGTGSSNPFITQSLFGNPSLPLQPPVAMTKDDVDEQMEDDQGEMDAED